MKLGVWEHALTDCHAAEQKRIIPSGWTWRCSWIWCLGMFLGKRVCWFVTRFDHMRELLQDLNLETILHIVVFWTPATIGNNCNVALKGVKPISWRCSLSSDSQPAWSRYGKPLLACVSLLHVSSPLSTWKQVSMRMNTNVYTHSRKRTGSQRLVVEWKCFAPVFSLIRRLLKHGVALRGEILSDVEIFLLADRWSCSASWPSR